MATFRTFGLVRLAGMEILELFEIRRKIPNRVVFLIAEVLNLSVVPTIITPRGKLQLYG